MILFFYIRKVYSHNFFDYNTLSLSKKPAISLVEWKVIAKSKFMIKEENIINSVILKWE